MAFSRGFSGLVLFAVLVSVHSLDWDFLHLKDNPVAAGLLKKAKELDDKVKLDLGIAEDKAIIALIEANEKLGLVDDETEAKIQKQVRSGAAALNKGVKNAGDDVKDKVENVKKRLQAELTKLGAAAADEAAAKASAEASAERAAQASAEAAANAEAESAAEANAEAESAAEANAEAEDEN